MKANGAKRKIFNDAIDLLDQMEEAAAVPENAVRMLPVAVYQKYFADRKTAEVADIVEKALEAWFRKEAPHIVQ